MKRFVMNGSFMIVVCYDMSGSMLLTTGKTELNAQGCQLWSLIVHIDLDSKLFIFTMFVYTIDN